MNVRAHKYHKFINVTITQPDEALFYIGLLDNYLSGRKYVDHGVLGDVTDLRQATREVWPAALREESE